MTYNAANKDYGKRIFICYAREDLNAAYRLYNELTNAGMLPWLDKKHILPGQNWKVTIKKAIKESRYFIALMSSVFTSKKGYNQTEVKLALDTLDEYPEEDIYIIPVRLDDCRITYDKLKDRHYVDMFPDWDNGLEQILRSVGIISHPDSVEIPRINPAEVKQHLKTYEDQLQRVTNKLTINYDIKEIKNIEDKEINYFISRYRADIDFHESVLKRLDELSRDTRLYRSTQFMDFLKELSASEDTYELSYFSYILHNLLILSKADDTQVYIKLRQTYKPILSEYFVNWNERYNHSHAKIQDILNTLV